MLEPGKYLFHCNPGYSFEFPQWIPSLNDYVNHETDTVLREVSIIDLITYKTVGAALAGFFRLIELGQSSFKANFEVTPIVHGLLKDTTYHLPLYDVTWLTISRPRGVHLSVRQGDQWVGYHHFEHGQSHDDVVDAMFEDLGYFSDHLKIPKSVLVKFCKGKLSEIDGYVIHTHVVS